MSKKQKLKQIICGLIMIVLGIISAIVCDDATAAAIIVPLGLGIMFTREEVIE